MVGLHGVDVVPRKHGLMLKQHERVTWVPGMKENSIPPQIPSTITTIRKKEREPHCEEYAMRESFFQEIKQQLGLNPSIDCFATSTNTKCPKFISREEDSLRVPWRSDETLWLNPPWPLWPGALEKLNKATCAAIAICPAWNKPWVRKLVGMASRIFYLERGTKLFEF